MSFILMPLLFTGCAGMFIPGVPLDVDNEYSEYIGVKLSTLQPAAIIEMNGDVGIHIPHAKPYGQLVTSIPVGSPIIINHVRRKYNVENDVYDYVMGEIEIPGYKGDITVAVCDARERLPLDRCIDRTKYKIIN